MRSSRHNVLRLLPAGLAAGCVINAFEYGVHRLLLDPQWTAAFAALGKTPTGWSTFIPSNFLVGIIGMWIYTRLAPRYGFGAKTAVRAAAAIWVVFWAIPLMAMQPMDLFPNSLIFTAIALGILDSIPAMLAGAWLYRFAQPPAEA